jgi:flagellar assembly protein FliH
MSNIINEDSLKKHKIEKFQFQSLGSDDAIQTSEPISFEDIVNQESIDVAKNDESNKPEVANEFLTKIEELTDENVKLQLALENLQKELDLKIEEESKISYQKGKEDGIKEATSSMQEHQDEIKSQLIRSVTNLDEKIHSIDLFLQEIKSELVDAATYIAKKVIKKELDENSQIIAKNIASSFLADLKDATQIKLKVNPQDETFLTKHLSTIKNIKIEPDDAINKGGIIILSDIGNIDANIQTRIQKAINLIKQED